MLILHTASTILAWLRHRIIYALLLVYIIACVCVCVCNDPDGIRKLQRHPLTHSLRDGKHKGYRVPSVDAIELNGQVVVLLCFLFLINNHLVR